MNKLKKIGLTALASSLVATSINAGELSVSGSASIDVAQRSQLATGKNWSMGNSVNFSGSGEMDNGLNVSVSFELDQGAGDGTGPFDDHSLTIGSDSLGSLTFAGHGGSTAVGKVDTTAAGDLWDNTLGINTATGGNGVQSAAGGNDIMIYTLPSIADGFGAQLSYTPQTTGHESSSAFNLSYTGIDGLAVHYAQGNDNNTANTDIDVATYKISYAYGPVTAGYSYLDYDHKTATSDQEVTSYSLSYTVSENISVSYGMETFERPGKTADIDVDGFSASYTSGGMTLSGTVINADNVDHSATAVNNDNEFWKLAASFAF